MKDNLSLKNFNIILITILSISIILIFLLYTVSTLERKIENEIFDISTTDIKNIVQNNTKLIEKNLQGKDNFVLELQQNKEYRDNLEKKLKLLITQHVKYIYLLYKDKNGIFRFLVDASNDEKAFLNQKFDVDNEKWFDVYKTKEPVIIDNDILHQLSITYLQPILNKNEVQLILAVDFSTNKLTNVNRIINNIKNGTTLLLVIILISLFVVIYQIIRYMKIKKIIFIDALTGAYNRNYMYKLENNLNLDDYILSVLDIDHFKSINDIYGHHVGDIVLKDTVKTIIESMREKDDYIIRYGGEEFIILTKKSRDNKIDQLYVVKRILKIIEETKFYISNEENKYIHITVSIGVNLNPSNAKNMNHAFKLADAALYDAKNSGRNCIKIYNENR